MVFRLVWVVFAYRYITRKIALARTDWMIVAEVAVPFQNRLENGLAVNAEFQRQADIIVVKGCDVREHWECEVLRSSHLLHADSRNGCDAIHSLKIWLFDCIDFIGP